MGNCQAAEAAAVVIEHVGGKVEKLYWPTIAGEVMRGNPGHHVALITNLCISQVSGHRDGATAAVRFTRIRILKPKDTLLLGQVYRLISSKEVEKVLLAKKNEKIRRNEEEHLKQMQKPRETMKKPERISRKDQTFFVKKEGATEGGDRRSAAKARQWRPKLQSISEDVRN